MKRGFVGAAKVLLLALGLSGAAAVMAQERVVYRCPGNLYTDQISAKEAAARGCKTLDGGAVTVVQAGRRSPPAGASGVADGGRPDAKVNPADQRARDSDARRILEAELRKEEDRLGELRKEYNGGNPERRGDERNYARYEVRVAELKAAIERKEADVAAIKRELAKLPAP